MNPRSNIQHPARLNVVTLFACIWACVATPLHSAPTLTTDRILQKAQSHWAFQPLKSSDALHKLASRFPSFPHQQGSDPPVAVARILPAQPHDALDQLLSLCQRLLRAVSATGAVQSEVASPTRAMRLNEVWSWDFVHDRTDNGVPLKMLTLIDEYSRQCLRIEVGLKLKSKEVLDALAGAMAERGVPHHIRSDNGPEFIARDVQDWLEEMGICTIYIDPGSPWQNGHVEPSGAR
jgi:hypothetical protein